MFANIEMGNVAAASAPRKPTYEELEADNTRLRAGIEDMIRINTDGLTVLNGESHAVLAAEVATLRDVSSTLLCACERVVFEVNKGARPESPAIRDCRVAIAKALGGK